MIKDICLALLPLVCGFIGGVVVAYPRGFQTGYNRAKRMLPRMVEAAVYETFNVGEGMKDGNRDQTPE